MESVYGTAILSELRKSAFLGFRAVGGKGEFKKEFSHQEASSLHRQKRCLTNMAYEGETERLLEVYLRN